MKKIIAIAFIWILVNWFQIAIIIILLSFGTAINAHLAQIQGVQQIISNNEALTGDRADTMSNDIDEMNQKLSNIVSNTTPAFSPYPVGYIRTN